MNEVFSKNVKLFFQLFLLIDSNVEVDGLCEASSKILTYYHQAEKLDGRDGVVVSAMKTALRRSIGYYCVCLF